MHLGTLAERPPCHLDCEAITDVIIASQAVVLPPHFACDARDERSPGGRVRRSRPNVSRYKWKTRARGQFGKNSR